MLEAGSITGIDRSAIFKQVAVTSDNQLVIATWKDAFILKKDGGSMIRVGEKKPGKGYYEGVICLSGDSSDNIYMMNGYTVHVFEKE